MSKLSQSKPPRAKIGLSKKNDIIERNIRQLQKIKEKKIRQMQRKAEIDKQTGKGGRFITTKDLNKPKRVSKNPEKGYFQNQVKRKRAISMMHSGVANRKLTHKSPKRRATRLDIKKIGSPKSPNYFRNTSEKSPVPRSQQKSKPSQVELIHSRPKKQSKFAENVMGMGDFDRRIEMSSLEKRQNQEIQKIKKGLTILKRKSKLKKMRRKSKVKKPQDHSDQKIQELRGIFDGMARESLDRKEYERRIKEQERTHNQRRNKSRNIHSKDKPPIPPKRKSNWNKIRDSSQGQRSRSPRDSSYAAMAHRRNIMREENRSRDKPYQSNLEQARYRRANSRGSFRAIKLEQRTNLMDMEYQNSGAAMQNQNLGQRNNIRKSSKGIEIFRNIDKLRKSSAKSRSKSRARGTSRSSRDKSPVIISEEMRGVKNIIRQQLNQGDEDPSLDYKGISGNKVKITMQKKEKFGYANKKKPAIMKKKKKNYRNRYIHKFLNKEM